NAIEVSETRFHADVNRLIEAIEKAFALVQKKAEPFGTPAAPPPVPKSKVPHDRPESTPREASTCLNCGGVLEKTPSGELCCMSCLLGVGIGSEQETVHDSTPDALGGRMRFGVYEIDHREDGSLYELGRGAMGVTYRATDTSLQRKVALKIIKSDI